MKKQLCLIALFGTAVSLLPVTGAQAHPLGMTRSAVEVQDALIEQAAVVVRRRPAARAVVVRPGAAVVRPRAVWARPGHYRWRAGGAIAAGAALGFLGAAAVASWAGPAPAPGLCWYYTDWSYRQGFWDYCP